MNRSIVSYNSFHSIVISNSMVYDGMDDFFFTPSEAGWYIVSAALFRHTPSHDGYATIHSAIREGSVDVAIGPIAVYLDFNAPSQNVIVELQKKTYHITVYVKSTTNTPTLRALLFVSKISDMSKTI